MLSLQQRHATKAFAADAEHDACGRMCRISPFLVTRILANSPAGAVSIRHGFQGPNRAAATACAAGADAIGDAFNLIRRGDADVMVAGGTEACVDSVALAAFGRCSFFPEGALTSSGHCAIRHTGTCDASVLPYWCVHRAKRTGTSDTSRSWACH